MNKWHYEQKDSANEFYNWLNNFEMPDEDFDYDVEYMAISDNIENVLGLEYLDYWEDIYIGVLFEHGIEAGEFLLNRLSDKDRKELKLNFDWEGNWEGVLKFIGVIDAGGQNGTPINKEYIKVFSDNKHKRLIFKLFIVSIVKYSLYDLFPDIENHPKQWWGCKIWGY